MPDIPRFFLGANSCHGFVSLFEQVYDPADGWRVILLKGGPGCGKSTLMTRCAQMLLEHGEKLELVHCSSDPKSLDAVILPTRKWYVVDATAPHVLEPKLPGACEILCNPGDCWDSEVLFARRDAITRLNACISHQHRRSRQFLSAAGALLQENRTAAKEVLQTDALRTYARRLAGRLFPRKKHSVPGTVQNRFLSGITPEGIVSFDSTLSCFARHILLLDDAFGPASTLLLEELQQLAQTAGYNSIVCPCPLAPEEKLDALIVPELSLALAVTGGFHRHNASLASRKLHLNRFWDSHALTTIQSKFRHDRKTIRTLLEESTHALAGALTLHDELETIYASAMDFSQLDRMTDNLLDTLRSQL